MYRLISRIYPKKFMERYKQILEYANIKTEPHNFAGFILFFGFGFAWFIAFAFGWMFNFNLWLTLGVAFFSFDYFTRLLVILPIRA